jgi:hypothetical protein
VARRPTRADGGRVPAGRAARPKRSRPTSRRHSRRRLRLAVAFFPRVVSATAGSAGPRTVGRRPPRPARCSRGSSDAGSPSVDGRYRFLARRGVRVGLRSATGNRVPAERWVAGSNPALSVSAKSPPARGRRCTRSVRPPMPGLPYRVMPERWRRLTIVGALLRRCSDAASP